MDDQNKNLLLATALSFLVILVWYVFIDPTEPPAVPAPAVATTEQQTAPIAQTATVPPVAGDQPALATSLPAPDVFDSPRLSFVTP